MGIISVEQTDRLYWLGRYTERVYTTLNLYFVSYDHTLDESPQDYEDFCRSLDIPNIYTSAEDFRTRYAFDSEDPNSIYSNLNRAYDNAIVLRESIGSESLSYIQLAIYALNKGMRSPSPLLELQKVMDNILAFWGVTDDIIKSENVRNIIKIGKRVERIDLYARLGQPKEEMEREICRLTGRNDRCELIYDQECLDNLNLLLKSTHLNYPLIVNEIERLVKGL